MIPDDRPPIGVAVGPAPVAIDFVAETVDTVRYVATPGPPATVVRIDVDGSAAAVPIVVWAGDGTITWGALCPGSIDAALSLLLDAGDGPAAAFTHAQPLAAGLLNRFAPQRGFAVRRSEILAAVEGDTQLIDPDPGGHRAASTVVVQAATAGPYPDGEVLCVDTAGATRTRFAVSAGPVRDAIEGCAALYRLGPLDAAEMLGLDAAVAAAVLDGAETVDFDTINEWCRPPRSPYDVWAPDEAHVISGLLEKGRP